MQTSPSPGLMAISPVCCKVYIPVLPSHVQPLHPMPQKKLLLLLTTAIELAGEGRIQGSVISCHFCVLASHCVTFLTRHKVVQSKGQVPSSAMIFSLLAISSVLSGRSMSHLLLMATSVSLMLAAPARLECLLGNVQDTKLKRYLICACFAMKGEFIKANRY